MAGPLSPLSTIRAICVDPAPTERRPPALALICFTDTRDLRGSAFTDPTEPQSTRVTRSSGMSQISGIRAFMESLDS
mgnify:CR=1 FL=1